MTPTAPPRIATLADLDALLERVILPDLSAERGEPVAVMIRRIQAREFMACLPARMPPRAEDWTPADAMARERAWLASLPEPERFDVELDMIRATARVVAVGVVDPPLTWHAVERLTSADADTVSLAILRLSGLASAAPPPALAAAPGAVSLEAPPGVLASAA